MPPTYRPYQPRRLRFLGVEIHHGYRLKRYAVSLDEHWPGADWQPAIAALTARLPQPAQDAHRPGVGVLLLHRGHGADYAVLAWWDQQNELPLLLWIRTAAEPCWRAARANESVCVWDLELLGFERDAYVASVLAGGELMGAIDDYLSRIDPRAASS